MTPEDIRAWCLGWWDEYVELDQARHDRDLTLSAEVQQFLELTEDLAHAAEAHGLDSTPLLTFLREARSFYFSPGSTLPVPCPDLQLLLERLKLKVTSPNPQLPVEELSTMPASDASAPAPTGRARQTPTRRKRAEIPDDYEANILIKKFLDTHPRATIREVAEAVGLSTGKVAEMDAWRREMAERKARKEPPRKAARQLTKGMLASIGQEDDVAARLDAEEVIWRRLLEKANPAERATLLAMSPDEKRRLIQTAGEQFADELAGSDDCS